MSLRPMSTVVIDCDNCDAVFYDAVPMTSTTAEKLAKQHGWKTDGVTHLCPKCAALYGKDVFAADGEQSNDYHRKAPKGGKS